MEQQLAYSGDARPMAQGLDPHRGGIHEGEAQQTNGLRLSAPPIAKVITIEPLNHGFRVSVGCQNFAIETVDALLHRLGVYLKNPTETELKWMAGEWKW